MQHLLAGLVGAGIAFVAIMTVVCWQVFNDDSWYRTRTYGTNRQTIWRERNWHYERHEKCDGLGVLWWSPNQQQWVTIPKDLRTGFPSLGNTKKCSCTMGRIRRLDDPIKPTEQDKI
jgi:hypothetical protein